MWCAYYPRDKPSEFFWFTDKQDEATVMCRVFNSVWWLDGSGYAHHTILPEGYCWTDTETGLSGWESEPLLGLLPPEQSNQISSFL